MPRISLGPDGITVDMGTGEAVTVIDGNGCECTFVSEAYIGGNTPEVYSAFDTAEVGDATAYAAFIDGEIREMTADEFFAELSAMLGEDQDGGTTDGSMRRAEPTAKPTDGALGYPRDAEETYMAFVKDALERIGIELRGSFYEMTYDERRNAARAIESGRAAVFVEVGERAD